MSHIKILFAISTLLIASLACVTIMGEEIPQEDVSPNAEEVVPPLEELYCPYITDQIVEANSYLTSSVTDEEETADFSPRDEDDRTYIASYLVSDDEIGEPNREEVPADLKDEQDDTATHQRIWDYYAAL